jgi:hypothetical protein
MRMLPALLLFATLAPAQKLEFDVATIKFDLRADSCCIPTWGGSSLVLETNRSQSMGEKTEPQPTDN